MMPLVRLGDSGGIPAPREGTNVEFLLTSVALR
jgi:hypothetical protein